MPILHFARPPLPTLLEPDTSLGVLRARLAGRSWWALRYMDGRIVHEWDQDPGSPNGHADWPRVPYHGRQAIRLYCPDGRFAQLGTEHGDSSGKLFQFKVGVMAAGVGRGTLAHVIGMLHGPDGECACYAWELDPEGTGHLVGPFADNVYGMRYHQMGRLNADVLGIDDGEGR